jgi:hypothetical protein
MTPLTLPYLHRALQVKGSGASASLKKIGEGRLRLFAKIRKQTYFAHGFF